MNKLEHQNEINIGCYYHPNRAKINKIRCHKCLNYFCEDDGLFINNFFYQRKICPICFMKESASKFLFSTLIFFFLAIIFVLIDVFLLVGLINFYKIFQTTEVVVILIVFLFLAISSIVLIILPFIERKRIRKLEYKILIFIRSIDGHKNSDVEAYERDLEKEYGKRIII